MGHRTSNGNGRGYFGIGIMAGRSPDNLGTLWRGAYQLGAAFIFTVGARYQPQAADTTATWKHVPLFQYATLEELIQSLYDCPLVAVETGGESLPCFAHPQRAAYLLGSEDNGLPAAVLARAVWRVTIPAMRSGVYNVAQAGTLVMYDRMMKRETAIYGV